MEADLVINKDLTRIILNMRWDLKHRRIPRRKWRTRIFEYLWGKGLLRGKPSNAFIICWEFLINQKLI